MVFVAFVAAAAAAASAAAAADSAGGSADESPNTSGSEQDAPLKELDRVLRFMTVRQARVFAVLRGTYPPRREDK